MSIDATIQQLKGELTPTGYTVYDHVPSHELDPPCLIIEPREPFLTPSGTYDLTEWLANFTVWILVERTGEYDTNNYAFQTALGQVLAKLSGGEWGVAVIGRPTDQTAGEWLAWGAGVQVSSFTNINP